MQQGKQPETGDEVWLHSKPTQESIERYLQSLENPSDVQREKDMDATPDSEGNDENSSDSGPAAVGKKLGRHLIGTRKRSEQSDSTEEAASEEQN